MAHSIANAPSITVMRGGNAVAESSTGPRKKKANGFSQSAGEEHHHRKLRRCRRPAARRRGRARSARLAEAEAQRDIEPGRYRDDREAGPDRQVEFEAEIDNQHRRRSGRSWTASAAAPACRAAHCAAADAGGRNPDWTCGYCIGNGAFNTARYHLGGPFRACAARSRTSNVRGRRLAKHDDIPPTRHRPRPPGQDSTRTAPRSTAFPSRCRRARSRPCLAATAPARPRPLP